MTGKEKRNYLRFIGVFVAILAYSHPLFSQNITVKGRTPVNEDDFYYVSILSAKDSTVLDYRYFDTPDFIMENIRQPEFILQISSPLLYKPYSCKVSNEQNQPVIDVGLIHLEPNVMSLDEVMIIARPPAVKFTEGKMVYGIQNDTDLTRLTSLEDVLKRIPFLSLSDNEISVFGKKNTVVLVNGVPPKNMNWELISPEDIKEIEVINNPPAEYSASGMAVVNIITRKTFSEGFNGQVATTLSKGDFWRSENVLQAGYATDKLHLHGSVNYSPHQRNYIETYERHFSEGNYMYNTITQKRNVDKNSNVVLGVDYIPHSRHAIGLQYQNYYFHPDRTSINTNDFKAASEAEHIKTILKGDFKYDRNIYDLSYAYQIDSVGKKLSVNMGYVDYYFHENNDIHIHHNNHESAKRTYSEATINLYTANIDYLHKTRTNFTGKTGVYFSHNRNNSHYKMDEEEESSDAGNQINPDNGAKIDENKLAGYISLRKQWSKLHLAAGLRYEHVSYKNKSKEGENRSKTYNDLFPSLEVGYEASEKLQTNLSFSRKVLYPSFQDLDPSMHYVDTFTYYIGNVNLQPEYSYNVGLDIVYNRFVNISLAYSRIEKPLTSVFVRRFNPTSMICLATAGNLNSQNVWTASVSVPFQYNAWSMQNSIGITYNDIRFESENIPMKNRKAMAYLYTYQRLKLPAGFNFSLTYQYNSPGVAGIFYHESNHVVNCALNKSFLADKWIVTLKYNDVFNGQKQRMWTRMQDVKFVQGFDFDNSVIALGITCKFGKSSRKYELKENSKEELKRIK